MATVGNDRDCKEIGQTVPQMESRAIDKRLLGAVSKVLERHYDPPAGGEVISLHGKSTDCFVILPRNDG